MTTLAKLSDRKLLAHLEKLIKVERATTLDILDHLNEVERRKLHLSLGYASMFEYCTRGLGYSESAASRRIKTARCIKEHAEIRKELADARLNLSTVSLIASVLTTDNRRKLLDAARGKSYHEVEAIVSRYKVGKPVRDRVTPVTVTRTPAPLLRPAANCKESYRRIGGKKVATEAKPVVVTEQVFKVQFGASARFMKKYRRVLAHLSRKYPGGVDFEKAFETLMDDFLDRCEAAPATRSQSRTTPVATQAASRHIPRAVREEVFARDGGKCTFVGAGGRRCGSTWNLEIDHIHPYGKGGDNSPENLRLLCANHNRLAAERTYGRSLIERKSRRE